MKGAVLQPFGKAMDLFLAPSPSPFDAFSMSMQEMVYWHTRVWALRIDAELTSGLDSESFSWLMVKGDGSIGFGGTGYNTIAVDEADVFRNRPVNEPVGAWNWRIEINETPSTSLVGVFDWFRRYLLQDSGTFTEGWKAAMELALSYFGSVMTTNPNSIIATPVLAGNVILQGVDLARSADLFDPVVYEHTIPIYYDDDGQPGTAEVTITPELYFPWTDPVSGAPTYDTTSGARLTP